jgi:hypothetical protein
MKALLVVIGTMVAAHCAAQMPDPTRPPGIGDPGVAGMASPAESGVQAVFLRHGAKPAALVNGEYVVQGGRLGDKRVVSISETAVVLRDAAGHRETMKVIAGAEKTPVAKKRAGPGSKQGRGGARMAPNEGATGK